MLDEPQHRVGDDVVEAVVGLGVGGDQLHAVLVPVRRLHWERLAAVVLGRLDVLVGHRRGDPRNLAVRSQPDQRGDETPGASADRPVRLERDRAAVGNEHQRRVGHSRRRLLMTSRLRAPIVQAPTCSNRTSQSRSRRGVRNRCRTDSFPARPSCLPSLGSRRTSSERWAHSSTVETRNPDSPSLT